MEARRPQHDHVPATHSQRSWTVIRILRKIWPELRNCNSLTQENVRGSETLQAHFYRAKDRPSRILEHFSIAMMPGNGMLSTLTDEEFALTNFSPPHRFLPLLSVLSVLLDLVLRRGEL